MSAEKLDLTSVRSLGAASPEPAEDATLTEREEPILVRYTAPDGTAHEASLISRVMDGAARNEASRIRARLAACVWDHLPEVDRARFWALSIVSVQIVDPPKWISAWVMQDDNLLFAIYREAVAHDARYFRGDEGSGQDATEASRVEVVPGRTTQRV